MQIITNIRRIPDENRVAPHAVSRAVQSRNAPRCAGIAAAVHIIDIGSGYDLAGILWIDGDGYFFRTVRGADENIRKLAEYSSVSCQKKRQNEIFHANKGTKKIRKDLHIGIKNI